MNKIHKRRLYLVCFFIVSLATATGLILYALNQNINAFVTPSQLASTPTVANNYFRLGGVVQPGSIKRNKNNLDVEFDVTDFKQTIHVFFTGGLPDLFREGKGVIAEGKLNSQGVFAASQILAKHDENYMPKNVYKALREGAK